MKREQAIAIGEDALIWLAGQPEALPAFLAASGLAPEGLRGRTSDPELLGAVLDFLLGSDAMTLDFAAASGIAPQAPARARAVLGGGELPNWT
jgi:Protein of unknown function (DUF3572)